MRERGPDSRADDTSPFRLGVTGRIALASAALVLVTSAAIGVAVYRPFAQALEERQLLDLHDDGRVIASRLHDAIAVLSGDTRLLASHPFVREQLAGGSDDAEWSEKRLLLESVLRSLIVNRPEYRQVRIIGVDDGGRELLRVERDSAGAIVTGALQRKGHRRFFREAIATPAGEVYFSRVGLNRENGEIEEPWVPVLRAAVAIHDEASLPLGILVVNCDLNGLVASLRHTQSARAEVPRALYLTDDRGEFLVHPDPTQTFAFEFGGSRRAQDEWPAVAGVFDSLPAAHMIQGADAVSIQRVHFDPLEPDRFLTVALAAPVRDVLASTISARRHALAVGAAVLAVSLLLALVMARSILRPLARVTRAVRRFTRDQRVSDLPLDSRTEIGVLAHSFEEMMRHVDERNAEFEATVGRAEAAEQRAEAQSIELARLVEDLKRSNRDLEEFTYVASHDLKAPLRGIGQLAAFVLEDTAQVLPDESRDHLEKMSQRVRRMEILLDDLLRFSRAGREERRVDHVDVQERLVEVVDLLELPEGIEVRIPSDAPELWAHRVALDQVFRNLIDNAAKHHDRPNGSIEIGWNDRGDFVEFRVSDDGPGIPVDQRERIFRLFTTLHAPGEVEGSGMGLAIIKKLVEWEGGTIAAESEGRGSTFRFTWPKRVEEKRPSP